MNLTRYDTASRFIEHNLSFLLQHEAENNLLIGVANDLAAIDPPGPQVPYAACVLQNDEIVAAALRTPPFNGVVSRGPQPAIDMLAEDIFTVYESMPGVLGPASQSRQFAAAWQRTSGQPFAAGASQRVYQLEQVQPVSGVPGRMRPATEQDRAWLEEWSYAFGVETHTTWIMEQSRQVINSYLTDSTRGMVVWEADRPVSIAAYAGPTPNGIRVSHVYTPPELRGHGYASAITAALSQHLLDRGLRYCFLFTDLSNPTSNKIYQRIGYQPVADVDEWLFT